MVLQLLERTPAAGIDRMGQSNFKSKEFLEVAVINEVVDLVIVGVVWSVDVMVQAIMMTVLLPRAICISWPQEGGQHLVQTLLQSSRAFSAACPSSAAMTGNASAGMENLTPSPFTL